MSTSNWDQATDPDEESEGIGDEGGALQAPGEGDAAVGDMGDGIEATLPDDDEPGAM
jgi:hypothetical protein